MLEDEIWMSGSECFELGFVDQVILFLQVMVCIYLKCIEEFEKMLKSICNMFILLCNIIQCDLVIIQFQVLQVKIDLVLDENVICVQVMVEQKVCVNVIGDFFVMFGNKYMEL